jgi:hypothetical protein
MKDLALLILHYNTNQLISSGRLRTATQVDRILKRPSVRDQASGIYEGKSLNNRNFILKCMEKYAQRKILFWDTKWLLSNMPYGGLDDRAVWACAIASTTWPLQCQISPWKSNEALFVFCGQRVSNLLKSTEERSMETVVWVRGECMNEWKYYKTDDKTSVMNTGEGDQLAWQLRQWNSRSRSESVTKGESLLMKLP